MESITLNIPSIDILKLEYQLSKKGKGNIS